MSRKTCLLVIFHIPFCVNDITKHGYMWKQFHSQYHSPQPSVTLVAVTATLRIVFNQLVQVLSLFPFYNQQGTITNFHRLVHFLSKNCITIYLVWSTKPNSFLSWIHVSHQLMFRKLYQKFSSLQYPVQLPFFLNH